MSDFRFIHAGDLGLDRSLVGLGSLNAAHAERLRGVTARAFERIVELCIGRQVDALLIAGDVYVVTDRPLGAHLRLVEGLECLEAAGIRVFIAPGPAAQPDEWSRALPLPANTTIFGPRLQTVPIDADGAVTVAGVNHQGGTSTRRVFNELGAGRGERVSIALLPAALKDEGVTHLASQELTYWALGTRRSRRIHRHEPPVIADPGPAQGLHAGESGPHGVYLVEVNGGASTSEFIATSAVRWERVVVETDGSAWPAGAIELAVQQIEALEATRQEDLLCEVVLTGRWPLSQAPSDPTALRAAARSINERLGGSLPVRSCTRVIWQMQPSSTRGERRAAGDAFGELLRAFDELRDNPDALPELRARLDALTDDPRLARHMPELRRNLSASLWSALDIAEGLAVSDAAWRS